MKNVFIIKLLFLLLILLNYSNATYIKDSEIVLLRSQFSDNEMIIDGKLDENIWGLSGSVNINFDLGDNFTVVDIKFVNDLTYIYFAISISSDIKNNTSAALYFDTDGDGSLSVPEDAKLIYFNNDELKTDDLHWNGDEWEIDFIQPKSSEFLVQSNLNNGYVVFEMRIKLISEQVQYNGFQIPSPSNTFISFSSQIKRQIGNITKVFNYPTTPSNASGFVDLKLAGPEDQDAPVYIPPTKIYINQTNRDNFENGTYSESSLNVDSPIIILAIISVSVIGRSIRKKRGNQI